jgi:hypothetical protein
VTKRNAVALAVMASLVLVSVEVLAHRPVAIGGIYDGPAVAVQLASPDLSQVVYGDLPVTHPSLWVAVDVPAATDLYVQIGVPDIDRLRTYRPQLAVLGPDLPALAIPVAVPAGLGGVLVVTSSIGDAVHFHEPFTDTDSWILGEATVRLPSAGRYYVVAWSSSIIDGKAWVAVGQREAFGWSDLVSLPRVIDEVRAFHELGPDPRLMAASKGLFLVVIAAVIACLALL